MNFKFKDYTVNYDVQGEGEPILLLNGIMMSTMSWEPFVNSFKKSNKLIRVDFLDQGYSSRMTEYYTQEIQVELLKELLDILKIDKVSVVGISYGGSIALQFACKHSERVNRMVLANSTANTSNWLKSIGDCWNSVALTRDGEAYYNLTIPVIYSPEYYKEKAEWMENRKKLLVPLFSNEIFLDSMIRLTKSAESHDVRQELAKLDIPTLIIASEEDYITPIKEQVHLHREIKNSQLVVLPNCGHASMYEKPVLFMSTVLGFINLLDLEYVV